MAKHIDIFMTEFSQYDVLLHFTIKFHEALIRAGIQSRLFHLSKQDPKRILAELFNTKPDCTLSFNGMLQVENGQYLCDLLKIYHINYLVDLPSHFRALVHSPYNIITCIDRYAFEFMTKIHQGPIFFLPHAVEGDIPYVYDIERPYDVVLLGSYIDYEKIAHYWKLKYPQELTHLLFEAAERVLSDQETSVEEAFIESINLAAKTKDLSFIRTLDAVILIHELEMYVRGYDRIRLLRSLQDVRVDVFGDPKKSWEKMGLPHCVFHSGIAFNEGIKVMQGAKIVINNCSVIKSGGHERIYTGFAAGAAVVTSENIFMQQTFQDEKNIIFYRNQELDKVNDKIHALLKDEGKRRRIAEAGRQVVLKHHTWDKRVTELLANLQSIGM